MGRNTTTPAARPPARPVIGLGGASARPGEREGPRGRRAAQAGRGEPAGRSSEGRARGSRGSPSGLGEAGRAISGGGSPVGSAQSGESSGPVAVRRALGAASPRVPAAFREEAAPRPGAASPASPSPPGGAEGQRVAASRRTSARRSVQDPARGAGSMATGLGEPVYGLSEEEVSSCPERWAEGTGPTPL